MRTATRYLGWQLSGLLLAIGCGGSAQPPESPAPAEPAPADPASEAPEPQPAPTEQATPRQSPDVPPPGSPSQRVMQAHFQDALLIRQAVIAGTPERTGAPAQVLTETYALDQLPKGWKPFVEQMQQAARRITDSASSAQAAAATADLGLACGACHSERGGPKPSTEPLPADGGSVRDRMKRHVWATERLWEGIYVPSADAWSAGARALSTEPFPGEILKSGGVHARSAAGDFKKLAATAPAKTSPRERAALYAEMLVTCGACHQATRN
jgi:cytochrome c553